MKLKNDVQRENARCIIVLGSGRSGTSALTGVLNILGASLGHNLVPPKEDNPRGFWEHKEIVAIHEKFLREMNSHWDDIRPFPEDWWQGQTASRTQAEISKILSRDFANASLWCLKDPRISRLLRLWHPVLNELKVRPHFIITYRNPLDVAASLYRVGKLSKEKSLLLWLSRTVASERETRRYPRVFVSYEELLYDWRATLACISDGLDIQWPSHPEDVSDRIGQFITPTLRPHSARDDELEKDSTLPPYIKDTYRCLKTNKQMPPDKLCEAFSMAAKTLQAEMDSFLVKAFIDDVCARNTIHAGVQKKLEEHIRSRQNELAVCEEKLRKIKESVLWRLTKPARQIYNKIHDKFC